jgi:hypothetical protein
MTRSQVWQRVLSRSYVASLPPDRLEEVRAHVDTIIDRHGCLFEAADGEAEPRAAVPLRLEVFLARKRG